LALERPKERVKENKLVELVPSVQLHTLHVVITGHVLVVPNAVFNVMTENESDDEDQTKMMATTQ
jgi:hypothetical protein